MTRDEEIRNAIDTIIPIPPSQKGRTYEQALMATGFEAGVSWADKHPINVWHDASEKPRTKEWVLIQFSGGDYEALSLDDLGIETWSDWWCENYKVIRWAYIKDLLPKECEKLGLKSSSF